MRGVGAAAPYAEYVSVLDALAADVRGERADPLRLAAALDGEAAGELRRLVPLLYRREVGAFFTSSAVRATVASLLRKYGRPPYFDAACGAGDLLLAAAEALPRRPSAEDTLAAWAAALGGADLHPEFVDAARARLWLAAVAATAGPLPTPLADAAGAFSGVRAGDGIAALRACTPPPQTIVLNPPFGVEPAPPGCAWGAGNVSRAATFTEQVVLAMDPGATIVAVLPDVLRSGDRLARWRAALEQHLDVRHVLRIGKFDPYTGVDVFALVGHRRGASSLASAPVEWWPGMGKPATSTVGARFEVNVGAVVDNRDPHAGPSRVFVAARRLPVSGRVARITARRRFAGRVFTPPFVLVRRTSAPSVGAARARGVLVTGKRSVAVDNHLLVLTPREGGIHECEELLRVLDAASTTTWLDDRIRCRHLTVGAVRDLPWHEGIGP